MFNILFPRIFAQFKKNTWRKTKDKQTEKDEKIKKFGEEKIEGWLKSPNKLV
jgi:hypothetical protein